MKKIGFLAKSDPLDRNSFSGVLFYMLHSLKSNTEIEVIILGEKELRPVGLWKVIKRGLHILSNRRILPKNWVDSYFNKRLVNEIIEDLNQVNIDYILAPVASDLIRELSNRSRIAPIIFITDATPNFLETFYGWPISTKHFETEKIALESAAHIIYSSDYMAELAKQDYQQEISNIDSKISVIPFGLNMDLIPDSLPEKSVTGPIKLVFIAREWERKGGQIALDTAIALNEKGTATHLTIIGCTPPDSVVDKPYITLVPFLNKNIPEDLEKYSSILSKAHFLILPTRADCTPMVIAECNSYGVPAVTTNVGGIPTLVTDGSNGILLELDDDFRVYEQKISDLFHDSDRFAKLSESSREVILNRLNWKIWAENVLKVTSKY